jgi:hypothetical protein
MRSNVGSVPGTFLSHRGARPIEAISRGFRRLRYKLEGRPAPISYLKDGNNKERVRGEARLADEAVNPSTYSSRYIAESD